MQVFHIESTRSCTMKYGFHEIVHFLPVRPSDCSSGKLKLNPAVIGFVLWISGLQMSLNVGAFRLRRFSHACRPDRAQRAQARQDWIGGDYFGCVSSFDLDGLWTNTAVKYGYVF